jgi:hypothetical protein
MGGGAPTAHEVFSESGRQTVRLQNRAVTHSKFMVVLDSGEKQAVLKHPAPPNHFTSAQCLSPTGCVERAPGKPTPSQKTDEDHLIMTVPPCGPVCVPQPLGVPYNPAVRAGFALGQWQIADGYQFNRIFFRGIFAPFDTNGFNASVTRFFGRELGVEGDVSAGFAPAIPSASAASMFVGGGPAHFLS